MYLYPNLDFRIKRPTLQEENLQRITPRHKKQKESTNRQGLCKIRRQSEKAMKITLIQTDIKWCSPQENLQQAEVAIKANPGSELYILPEMFTTGFCMNPKEIAEPQGGAGFRWMLDAARRYGAAIAGSIATEEGGKYYNRFYFVEPSGEYTQYDKVHLFTYSGEDKAYTKGTERKIIEYRGIKILPIICYDLRFPVFIRNREEYDLIICVANWPAVRNKPWRTLIKARAIENQCYVAAVNRAGKDEWGEYTGDTKLINPYGEPVAECKQGVADTINTEIDIEALENFRKKFPVLEDADNFTLNKDE